MTWVWHSFSYQTMARILIQQTSHYCHFVLSRTVVNPCLHNTKRLFTMVYYLHCCISGHNNKNIWWGYLKFWSYYVYIMTVFDGLYSVLWLHWASKTIQICYFISQDYVIKYSLLLFRYNISSAIRLYERENAYYHSWKMYIHWPTCHNISFYYKFKYLTIYSFFPVG